MCKRLHYSGNVEGTPTVENGHVRMGIRDQLAAIQRGFEIVTSFPEWKNTPIILGESDPEGCAACSAQKHAESAYRNGSMFAAYTAEILNQIDTLASQGHVNFQGALAWSFEFENQPYFAGFRELPTNGIDKPVLNAFRMLGQLSGRRLAVKSAGAVPADEILKAGVRGHPDVNAIATRREREITILVWNYHDDDVPAIGYSGQAFRHGNAPGSETDHSRTLSHRQQPQQRAHRMATAGFSDESFCRRISPAGRFRAAATINFTAMEKGDGRPDQV